MADENFGQIVNFCASFLTPNGDTNTIAIIKNMVNLCHADICGLFRWTWLQRKATLPIGANVANILLPDGSSVVDVGGATPAYCRQVLQVSSVSAQRHLTPQPLILYELKNGRVGSEWGGYEARSFWAQYNRQLYAVPAGTTADQLEIFYIAGHTTMLADSAEPLIPGPYRNTLIWRAIAHCSALDTFDRSITQMAMNAFNEAMAGLRSNSEVMAPAYISLFNVTGMVC